jgi:hypothetical protein
VESFSTAITIFQIYSGGLYSDEFFHLEFSGSESIQGMYDQNNDACETISKQ